MTGKGLVAVAYAHPGEVDGSFHESMLRLIMADHTRAKPRILGGGGTIGMASGPRIAAARNEMVQRFLSMPTEPEWLLMVDSDMVFAPSALDKLLEAADPKTAPIIGGLCFGGGRSGKVFPTLYRLRQTTGPNDSPIEIIEDYPADTVCKVDATGAAFLLMHRDALVKIGEAFKGEQPWFCESTVYKGVTFGEDWAFCMRAKSLGYDIFVHTGVRIGHVKPHILDQDAFDAYRELRDRIGDGGIVQRHRWRLEDREPADAKTYVAIPFKGKLDMTGALAWQLFEQEEADDVFFLNNGEALTEAEEKELACDTDKALFIDCQGLTIHQMWNEAIRTAQEEAKGRPFNLAFLNNDLAIRSTHFLSKLATALRADDLLLAVSPRYDDRPDRGVQYVDGSAGAGGLAGFCFMVKGEAFAAGLPTFDEKLQWWYGDDDLVLNISRSGHRVGIVHAVEVEHLGGGSQTAGDWQTDEWQAVIRADRAYLKRKWGVEE